MSQLKNQHTAHREKRGAGGKMSLCVGRGGERGQYIVSMRFFTWGESKSGTYLRGGFL